MAQGDKVIYFLVGSFVGAAVALLFAPKLGEETRNFLGTRYRDSADKLGSKAAQGRTQFNEGSQWLADQAAKSKETLAKKSREAAERFTATVDQGKETVTKQKEQVAKAVKAGKKAYLDEKRDLKDGVEPSAG